MINRHNIVKQLKFVTIFFIKINSLNLLQNTKTPANMKIRKLFTQIIQKLSIN